MYQVYIRHFLPPEGYPVMPGQTIIEQEELMYELPRDYQGDDVITEPKVKNEMGKAGSFEFGMEQNNPWYSSLIQLTTLMRVKYDDETIFFGRVLAIDTDMWGKRKVHCEGALAFLLDTMMEATKEEDREEISLQKYVEDLIGTHNRLTTDEPSKNFEIGQVPGHYSNSISDDMKPDTDGVSRKYGSSSWTSVMNCLEDLTSKYGGYWRARYNDNNGKIYLDWLRNFFDAEIINQPLELTENIIDISNTVDVNGIFTVLIPEGSKNGQSIYLDDIPKTITKVPVTINPEPKEPIGPGLGPWVAGQGVVTQMTQ